MDFNEGVAVTLVTCPDFVAIVINSQPQFSRGCSRCGGTGERCELDKESGMRVR